MELDLVVFVIDGVTLPSYVLTVIHTVTFGSRSWPQLERSIGCCSPVVYEALRTDKIQSAVRSHALPRQE